MGLAWILAISVTGLAIAPVARGLIFRHSVHVGQPWRRCCPNCSASIWFLWPSGRCPGCRERTGPPAATVEIVTALVLGLLAWRVDDPLVLLACAWTAVIGVVLAFVDIAVHRLPDRLTLPAFVGAVPPLALAGPPHRLGIALLCALGMAAAYLVLIMINPSGMGLGDAKLALSLGLALGWWGGIATLYGAAAGFILAGIYAAAMLVAGRLGRKDSIAHGPFMLLGALAVLVWLPHMG